MMFSHPGSTQHKKKIQQNNTTNTPKKTQNQPSKKQTNPPKKKLQKINIDSTSKV